MTCPLCGVTTGTDRGICDYHGSGDAGYDRPWSEVNRAYCDFFHRGIVPVVPPEPVIPDDPLASYTPTDVSYEG